MSPIQAAILAAAREDREAAGGPSASAAPTPGDPLSQTPTTREDLARFFAAKADPESLAFKGSQLLTEVAATAGVGGGLGAVAKALGAAPAVSSALASGGLSLGGEALPLAANIGLRSAAGAVTGAVSAGLVNPEEAAAGGAIGAVTPGAAWLAGIMGRGLAKTATTALGMSSTVGGATIQEALTAGFKGDATFLKNMRASASTAGDLVEQAKDALGQMRAARGDAYRQGMAAVSGDKTVLDMQPIRDALSNAPSGMFNGKVVNEDLVKSVQKMNDKVAEWASSDPNVFHTVEGFDQLKQAIGAVRETTQPGTKARTAVDQVYNSVKSEIVKQAPAYGKIMSDYESASSQLDEIQKSLSLGDKASTDTALRKLQSVLRNNVNTNYGNRLTSVQALQQQGGANLIPALAGQAMSSWTPRGIQGAIEGAALPLAAFTHPAALAAVPFTSPRLVGESLYKLGQGASIARPLGRAIPRSLNPNIPIDIRQYLNDRQPDQMPDKNP
jgi:hypothetical protein